MIIDNTGSARCLTKDCVSDFRTIMNRELAYEGVVYRTNDAQILLRFHRGSEAWLGVYPGCSFDCYYDEVIHSLCEMDPEILVERQHVPLIVFPTKDVGLCQNQECDKATQYKYCSISCWFFTMLDCEEDPKFREALLARYGCYDASANVAKS